MFKMSNYRCIAQIAKQSTTTIYRGIHIPSGEEVAIKYPDPGCRQTAIEAEILSELHHEAIIQLRDIIPTENGPALVLPFASQSDLYSAMIASNGIRECDAKPIAFTLFKALEDIHTRGICHCDIKPENVLIMSTDFESAVLCDFGYAIHVDRPRRGIMEGTDNYTAPEIWELSDYSEKADIWSVGVALFEAMTCSVLFNVSESDDPCECIRDGLRELLSRTAFQGLSSDCKDLLNLLLCPDPSDRITASAALTHPWFGQSRMRTVDPRRSGYVLMSPRVSYEGLKKQLMPVTRPLISVY
jgi:serine/threonine protein kinase